MSKIIKAPRGTFDILPEDMPLWYALERSARDAFARYGYSEVRTPLIEELGLFIRGIGETTDIVEKEIFSVTSSKHITGGRAGDGSEAPREDVLGLRPEGTAGVVRAYIEHGYPKTAPMQKFWYMGPMFRYERPQAGRQRQFSQIGVEVLGTYAPEADVETIALALDIIKGAGLADTQLKVNSIGCPKCRPGYRDEIRRFIGGRVDRLCGDCKRRFERNIFRVLDCKQPGCKALTEDIPEIEGYLCEECGKHFERVKKLLGAVRVEYAKDKYLVRGFDYYTRTIYEIAHSALGARDAVCGGGRYDNLVEELGGPATGAVGFSIGMEPTLLAMKNSGVAGADVEENADAFAVVVDDSLAAEAIKRIRDLRSAGIKAEMMFDTKSVKAQMRAANKKRARVVLIFGPEELAAGGAKAKDMQGGEERIVPLDGLVAAVKGILGR